MDNFEHLTDIQKLELASSLIGDVFFQYQSGNVGTQLASADSCLDLAIQLIEGV